MTYPVGEMHPISEHMRELTSHLQTEPLEGGVPPVTQASPLSLGSPE